MFTADSNRNASRAATLWFVLAGVFLIVGGISSPLFLAVALGFIAAGLATSRSRQDTIHGAVLIAFVAVAFAYGVGKDMAFRDNARSAAVHADAA